MLDTEKGEGRGCVRDGCGWVRAWFATEKVLVGEGRVFGLRRRAWLNERRVWLEARLPDY